MVAQNNSRDKPGSAISQNLTIKVETDADVRDAEKVDARFFVNDDDLKRCLREVLDETRVANDYPSGRECDEGKNGGRSKDGENLTAGDKHALPAGKPDGAARHKDDMPEASCALGAAGVWDNLNDAVEDRIPCYEEAFERACALIAKMILLALHAGLALGLAFACARAPWLRNMLISVLDIDDERIAGFFSFWSPPKELLYYALNAILALLVSYVLFKKLSARCLLPKMQRIIARVIERRSLMAAEAEPDRIADKKQVSKETKNRL